MNPWIPVTEFQTGWSTDSNDPLRFRLEGDIVRLAGNALVGTGTGIFNLPLGFRPDHLMYIPIGYNEQVKDQVYLIIDALGEVAISEIVDIAGMFNGIAFPIS